MSVFTKRHYNAVAAILRNSRNIEEVATKMSRMFESDNPRFSPEKFWDAVFSKEVGD